MVIGSKSHFTDVNLAFLLKAANNNGIFYKRTNISIVMVPMRLLFTTHPAYMRVAKPHFCRAKVAPRAKIKRKLQCA